LKSDPAWDNGFYRHQSDVRAARAADEAAFPPHPRWKFVFVNHVTANPFFVPCQYGIQDACALLGCDYQWTGSETSDVAQMVNAMNTAIAGKADAIAVCLVDPKGFDRPVENALAAGIPVFSYNADSKTNKRLAYRPGSLPFGADNGRAHCQAGRLGQGVATRCR
jgi:simple sugar transport system substrate-binding protein